MMLIGLTGKMGSGKSTVARLFQSWGVTVISADRIGWEVLKMPLIEEALAEEFGKGILDGDGHIVRKTLGRAAFERRDRLDALNRITHPPLLALLQEELKRRAREKRVVLLDAALIVEWGIVDWFDKVIVIVCSEKEKVARLVRSGMDRGDAERRLFYQVPDEERVKYGDYVIDNSGTLEELEKKARDVLLH
jgi:dephospho-CoA kinase